MTSETTLTFEYTGDLWKEVSAWAPENGFKLKGDESFSDTKVYQRGKGFLTAPMKVQIKKVNGIVDLKAWISINLFSRMGTFFILPKTIGIESGGMRAVLPRRMARKAVNNLLKRLGLESSSIG